VLASRRAHRTRAAGVNRLLELGCGVGADLLAFSSTGIQVISIERDALTAAVARANLEASGLEAEVEVGDARDRDRNGFDAVFTDPARRAGSRRIFDPSAFSPSWDFVADLLTGDAIVKAAPGIPHELLPSGVEAEWVSLDGQLREATMWSGRFAEVDRRASVLTSAGSAVEVTDAEEPDKVDVFPVGRYVYEPDDAVVRAHLVGAVAAAVDGWLLDPHLAYVSGYHRRALPIAKGYEVLEVLPYQEKQLRSALRARDVGSLTIKKRGVGVAPEVLRRRLGLRGSRPATVILSRTPSSAVALLVEPLPR
jgi:hypothetical protein